MQMPRWGEDLNALWLSLVVDNGSCDTVGFALDDMKQGMDPNLPSPPSWQPTVFAFCEWWQGFNPAEPTALQAGISRVTAAYSLWTCAGRTPDPGLCEGMATELDHNDMNDLNGEPLYFTTSGILGGREIQGIEGSRSITPERPTHILKAPDKHLADRIDRGHGEGA